VAIVGIARRRLGVEHELTAWGAGIGGDDRGFDAKFVRRAGVALADALDFGRVEGIELPAALALLLGSDLAGAQQRNDEGLLQRGLACDVAADVADDAAEARSKRSCRR